VTRYLLNAFGRVTTHTEPEGGLTYVYYQDATGTKNNDNISKITVFSEEVTDYIYDNLGRAMSQSVVYDDSTFTKTMAYVRLLSNKVVLYPLILLMLTI